MLAWVAGRFFGTNPRAKMQIQPNGENAASAGKSSQAERAERPMTTGQRRQATVLFADMVSFTPTAERLGEERTFLLMAEFSAL